MATYMDAVNGKHTSGAEFDTDNVRLPDEVAKVFARTDWRLLARQKVALGDPCHSEFANAVDGIINWISAVQDALVDSDTLAEDVVFPEECESSIK